MRDEYRTRVRALRADYATRYAPEIGRLVADAPPLSVSQLAWLRRIIHRNGQTFTLSEPLEAAA